MTVSAPPKRRSAPQLLADARVVLEQPGAIPTASWSRAVAVLARQAIERGMLDLWSATRPELVGFRNKKAQFLCLRETVDPALAGRTYFTWSALSAACHHHVYDLSPTELELNGWLETVAEFLGAVARVVSSSRPVR